MILSKCYTVCYYCFSKSGEIDFEEFLEMVEAKPNAITKALFSLVDVDDSGSIDFNEYIQVLSTYCLLSKDKILRFCFDVFDEDSSGTLDQKEFSKVILDLNSNSDLYFSKNFEKAFSIHDKNGDGLIDFTEFKDLNKTFPLLTYTAFRLQQSMQVKTLGERKWRSIIKRLNEMRDD